MCRLAPLARYGQVSQTAASKPTAESSVARSSAVTAKAATCQSTRLASERWPISTPLGRPVEPDV